MIRGKNDPDATDHPSPAAAAPTAASRLVQSAQQQQQQQSGQSGVYSRQQQQQHHHHHHDSPLYGNVQLQKLLSESVTIVTPRGHHASSAQSQGHGVGGQFSRQPINLPVSSSSQLSTCRPTTTTTAASPTASPNLARILTAAQQQTPYQLQTRYGPPHTNTGHHQHQQHHHHAGSSPATSATPSSHSSLRPPGTPAASTRGVVPQRLNFQQLSTASSPDVASPTPTAATSVCAAANRNKRVKVETASGGGSSSARGMATKTESEVPLEVATLRRSIVEYRSLQRITCREAHAEHVAELYFLQGGLNIMDFLTWRRRSHPQLAAHLRANAIDSDEDESVAVELPQWGGGGAGGGLVVPVSSAAAGSVAAVAGVKASSVVLPVVSPLPAGAVSATKPVAAEVKVPTAGGTPVALSTMLPASVAQLSQQGGTPIVPKTGTRTATASTSNQPASVAARSQASAHPPSIVPSSGTPASRTPVSHGATTSTTSTTPLAPTSAVAQKTSAQQQPPAVVVTSAAATPSTRSGAVAVAVTTASSTLTTTTVGATTTSSTTAVKSTRGPPAYPGLSSPARLATRQHSISAVYDSTIGSQEEIVERAKQEAYVVQRIADLRKEGLWSEKRLPKVQEPPRSKAHWDYLLEEMLWLATDFAQERKWKKAAAKKCARMCQKFHVEQKLREERAEREAEHKLKRIAGFMAKEIKLFWANVEKLVEHKQQSRLEEKRKKAMDHRLNFIVDQTEKYSSWLTQGLNTSAATMAESGRDSSAQISRSSSPGRIGDSGSDDEFCPAGSEESDDEETIAKEEEEDGADEAAQQREAELLARESTLPLEELLRDLPMEVLQQPAQPLVSRSDTEQDDGDDDDDQQDAGSKGDVAFRAGSDADTSDDEATLDEQEEVERGVDHAQELLDLKDENELTLDELVLKYRDAYTSDFEANLSASSSEESASDDDDSSEHETEEEASSESECDPMDIGLETLINTELRAASASAGGESAANAGQTGAETTGPSREITDIAAAAESFKPKGYTYSTAQVATKVPFLLKHQLREYQHIGLDWLVTMYERKLNGILADEMGLGKTIQAIALLAHLACEKGNWGPHLIVVPTSVMLNWEMELKKWCPAFKILTYYGSQKERKLKRQGWTKPNTFHVCITSYKLVIQDHQSFRRKRWKYFILDEAQNIKNFKSQRWQLLLNFQSQRRLLLTGTPLQNSLMELWSLMHFLMPNVFQSHRDFKEWFANPVSGMIEGSHEYNKELISRLHKVLRPFLLRRLKSEVEKQLPGKYEHVVLCRLSKRQRYLYDDFMSQAKTKETLASGNYMSVIHVIMQLRKVCNHPNLFEARPTISPFQMNSVDLNSASLAFRALEYDPFKHVDLYSLNLLLSDLELNLTAFAAHRIKRFQTPRKLIEEIDSAPDPPPKCPAGKIKLHVRTTSSATAPKPATTAPVAGTAATSTVAPTTPVAPPSASLAQTTTAATTVTAPVTRRASMPTNNTGLGVATRGVLQSPVTLVSTATTTSAASAVVTTTTTTLASGVHPLSGYTLQLVQPQGGLSVTSAGGMAGTASPITVQIQQTQQGPRLTLPSGQLTQIPAGFAQLVQTSTGQHILLTSSNPQTVLQPPVYTTVQSSDTGLRTTATARLTATGITTVAGTTATVVSPSVVRPVLRMPNVGAPKVAPVVSLSVAAAASPVQIPSIRPPALTPAIVTRSAVRVEESPNKSDKIMSYSRSLFHLTTLTQKKREHRQQRLARLSKFNTRRCDACPVFGGDLVQAATLLSTAGPASRPAWAGAGRVHCLNAVLDVNVRPDCYWRRTHALDELVFTPERLLLRLNDILTRFAFVVPSVVAPPIRMSVSHPSPSTLAREADTLAKLRAALAPLFACLHPIASATSTQFPDPRLIQYDCGKLQTLDSLLRRLKTEGRRVLIFTQMTRMLDILEQFLNFHGHIYLRLDGTTRVEMRQSLMERFNADRRIFCFILSTRSGGIGVNLTGADTVIFYDSDWNPTMDAQAQDRCHRIGQTRDVHIYRLISDRTVEENILKKANQKRLLSDVAIEGGNFNTALMRRDTIKELFDVNFDFRTKIVDPISSSAIVVKPEIVSESTSVASVPAPVATMSAMQLELALANVEEESDIQAAKTAKAEAAAELAEFDESIPYDGDGGRNDDESKVEEGLDRLMMQLTPVERYAMNFLESTQEPFTLEQLKQAEEEIEAQKKEWELGRLQALREEEERRAQQEDNDIPYTYSREDAYNQVHKSTNKVSSASRLSRAAKVAAAAAIAANTTSTTTTTAKSSPEKRASRRERCVSGAGSAASSASSNSRRSSVRLGTKRRSAGPESPPPAPQPPPRVPEPPPAPAAPPLTRRETNAAAASNSHTTPTLQLFNGDEPRLRLGSVVTVSPQSGGGSAPKRGRCRTRGGLSLVANHHHHGASPGRGVRTLNSRITGGPRVPEEMLHAAAAAHCDHVIGLRSGLRSPTRFAGVRPLGNSTPLASVAASTPVTVNNNNNNNNNNKSEPRGVSLVGSSPLVLSGGCRTRSGWAMEPAAAVADGGCDGVSDDQEEEDDIDVDDIDVVTVTPSPREHDYPVQLIKPRTPLRRVTIVPVVGVANSMTVSPHHHNHNQQQFVTPAVAKVRLPDHKVVSIRIVQKPPGANAANKDLSGK